MAKKQLSEAETVAQIVKDVYRLNGLFRRWRDILADKVGQTQARWQVLSAARDGNQTVAQIGRRLGVSRQNVQRIADLLRADMLVEYVFNRNHERSPYVKLTREGEKSLATLENAGANFYAELAEGLPLDDLGIARVVLRKFTMQLERDLTPVEELTVREMGERAAAAAMRGKTWKPQ